MDFLIFQVPMLTLQAVLDGLLLGILFALIAYGMALQWGVMNIINIAQGDLVILGGYIAYFMYLYGIHPAWGVIVSPIIMYFVGVIIYKLVINKVVMITWIIAAILATIGGTLYGLDKSFKPFTYFNNMLPIFAAAIVGGIGNPFGAFLGGYVIAFSEILVTYAYRKFFIYLLPESIEPDSLLQLLSTDYKFAVSFSILVVVLLFRPSGIFKGKVL